MNHLTGELEYKGKVPGRADVNVPSFGEGSVKGGIMAKEYQEEQARKAREEGGGGGGVVDAFNVAPTTTTPGPRTLPLPATPSLAPTQPGQVGPQTLPATPAPTPTQPGQGQPTLLQPRGIGPSGISPDVINSPEFQQLLEEVILKKSTGGL
jgi:hypothetical protein